MTQQKCITDHCHKSNLLMWEFLRVNNWISQQFFPMGYNPMLHIYVLAQPNTPEKKKKEFPKMQCISDPTARFYFS